MNADVPSVPSFEGPAPLAARVLLASGRGASAARLCSSEQRGSTSPLKVRPPPPLRNIERRRSETWAARRARRPKHGAITCSYDNQDDLKLLCGRASRRDWAFCPVAFASGLRETSHGWSVRLEGFAGGLAASSIYPSLLSSYIAAQKVRLTAVATQNLTQSLVVTSSQLPIAGPWLEKLHVCGRTAAKTRQHPAFEQSRRARTQLASKAVPRRRARIADTHKLARCKIAPNTQIAHPITP